MTKQVFTLEKKDGEARAGILHTPHGDVPTPAFMPVATKGSVKTVTFEELEALGARAIIANALHLFLRPGIDTLKRVGGLHAMMRWPRTIFTDSGGFQILREGFQIKLKDEGLHFRDFYSGAKLVYTPETCMEVQKAIGSDVAMLLDDCPAHDAPRDRVTEAIERTLRWAERGIRKGRELGIPLLFAITQGGTNLDFRKWCTEELEKLSPDGYGIGGLSIGESKEDMIRILDESTHLLPADKPRYLMGVGSAEELLTAVEHGVDIFDSVFPTQCARHGTIFTREGRYNMRGAKLERDDRPLDPSCGCWTCRTYSRSYINHLLRVKEMLGMRLTTIHNLHYMQSLVRRAREAILNGTYQAFRKEARAAVDFDKIKSQ